MGTATQPENNHHDDDDDNYMYTGGYKCSSCLAGAVVNTLVSHHCYPCSIPSKRDSLW